jgi:preprotein translocase subunit Sss1
MNKRLIKVIAQLIIGTIGFAIFVGLYAIAPFYPLWSNL